RAALSAGGGGSAGATALTGFLAAEGQRAAGDFGFAIPDVRGGGRGVRQNAATSSVNVLASGTARRGAGELSGRLEGFGGDRGMPGSVVQPALTAHQEQRRGGAALAARAPWLGVEWRADADAQLQTAAFRDPRPPTDTAYDESVDAASGGVALSGRGPAGPIELTGGAEARGLRVTSSMLGEGAPRGQTLGAVWAQAGWHPFAGGWALEVFGAARADWSTLLRGATLSPRVGASAERGRWIGRMSAGRAFAPPTLADQFFHDGVLTRPNPDLRPERVRNEVEAALELRDAPLGSARFDAEVAAYRADVDGMILWLPDYQFRWSPSNFDVARRGGEVTVRARFPRAELRGTLSHAEVEYRGPVLSGQVALRPRDTGSAAAAATVAGVRAELQGRWVGERFPDAGNTANRIESHFLADLRLARPFALRGWRGETTLAVENLADRDAAMLVDYPYPGRTWSVGLRVRRGAPSPHSSERTDR
ncbi:MAG TPA: TonB-dependent receptor, partial [Longimicrobium sp.]|nr:TonB-dependent receptor [Longimicrobium sp.]